MKKQGLLATATLLVTAFTTSAGQAQSTQQTEVALRVHGGRLIVPVETTNGAKLEFALSTGYPMTILSESGAARIGDTGKLTLGGLPVPTDQVHQASDEDMTIDGKVFDGTIGSNMLNQYNVLLDVPGGRLLLKPFGRAVSWDGVALSDPIRVRVFHGVVISLDAELGGIRYPAALDIGLSALVVNAGVNIDTPTLRIGNNTFSDLPLRVEDNEILRRWSPDGAGFIMVGAPITFDCAISISYVHQEIRTCVR